MKNGWNVQKISDVCDVVNGGTPKTGVDEYWNGHHLWITPADMGKLASPYVSATKRMLSDKGLANSSARLMPPNSIILSSRAPIGHLIINTKPMATNQGCKGLVPKHALYYKFLYYFLSGNVELLNSLGTGATFKELSATALKDVRIPVPPIDEQRRIVAILDEAFAAIDKAKANTEKNIQNARELFDSYLNNIFSNPGPDWETKRLKDFAAVCGGYSFKSTDFKKSGKYQVLRMGNVRPGCIRPSENPVFIDDAEENVLRRALLKPGDIIITQTGTKKKRDYGFSAMIDGERYLLNQRLASIRIKETATPKFFLYFSWTDLFKDQFFANETGTVGQGNVGIGAITDSLVPYCDKAQQEEIVARLDDFYQDIGRLEAANTRKIAELGELKQSLLQKAFSGELSL